MPFDAEGYRKAARAQGIPDSEIEKDIAEEMKSAAPKADFDFPKKGEAEAKGADSWMAPAAIVGLGSAAVAAPGIYKSLREKFKPTPTTVQIDPQLDSIPKEWQSIVERSQQNAAAKAADAAAKANPIPRNYTSSVPANQPNVGVNPAGAFTPPSAYGQTTLNAPSNLGQPNINSGPIVPTAEVGPPSTPPSVQAGVETGNSAKAVQAVVAQEIDKSAGMYRNAEGKMVYPEGMSPAARSGYEAFTKQYPDIAKTLETKGQFGILGAGSGDNNLFNSYDSDLMKRLRNEVNQGQMVGPYTNYEKVVNPAIKAISPETAIGKELAALPEKGGNFGRLGVPATIGGKKGGLITGPNDVPKIVKAGGPALLLMSMADAAKAATEGNMSPSKELGFDLATGAALAKLFGGPAAAAGAMAFGSKGLNPNEEKELAYLRKVGTGRGIAPPSAYKR